MFFLVIYDFFDLSLNSKLKPNFWIELPPGDLLLAKFQGAVPRTVGAFEKGFDMFWHKVWTQLFFRKNLKSVVSICFCQFNGLSGPIEGSVHNYLWILVTQEGQGQSLSLRFAHVGQLEVQLGAVKAYLHTVFVYHIKKFEQMVYSGQ